MTPLTTHIADLQAATAFGAAGLAAQVVWPFLNRREPVLLVQMAAAVCHGTAYVLIGQDTAAAVCVAGATQTAVALMAGNRPWLRQMGLAFLPLIFAVGILTYSGLPTLLAVAACCLTMIGRLQSDMLRLRAVQLTASPLGAAHDALVGAWPALAAALLTFTIASFGLRRELARRRAAA